MCIVYNEKFHLGLVNNSYLFEVELKRINRKRKQI